MRRSLRSLSAAAALASAVVVLLAACGDDTADFAACGSEAGDDAESIVLRMITPARERITDDQVDRTTQIICERAEVMDAEAVVTRSSEFELQVQLSGPGAAEARRQIGAPSQIGLYDWALMVIPDPDAPPDARLTTPFAEPYNAVRLASGLPPDCAEEKCTVPGATSYLFDLRTKQLIDGPSLAVEGLLEGRLQGEEGSFELLSVRVGQIVLRERGSDEYWVLRDRPSVSASQITEPEVTVDPDTGEPAVLIRFTEDGALAFERMTRKIAERDTPPSVFGVALDLELLELSEVDPVADRKGRDPEQGLVITGGFTEQEAERLVSFLEIGNPPVGLAPVD